MTLGISDTRCFCVPHCHESAVEGNFVCKWHPLFLWIRCASCHRTNSVKAQKEAESTDDGQGTWAASRWPDNPLQDSCIEWHWHLTSARNPAAWLVWITHHYCSVEVYCMPTLNVVQIPTSQQERVVAAQDWIHLHRVQSFHSDGSHGW